jgi:hypothetical protein
MLIVDWEGKGKVGVQLLSCECGSTAIEVQDSSRQCQRQSMATSTKRKT